MFVLLLFVNGGNHLMAQTKHALLIGVGDYPANSGWQDLGAANDIDLLKNALQLQGFTNENVLLLKDQAATKAAIIQHLNHQLYENLTSGDIVLVHFSGHGQQIADKNGDEVDGYDEAIVPYDSPLKYEKGHNEGEQLIRDEELGALLLKIRKKLGVEGHLLVTIDACHSGTGTRGLGIARGTNRKMAGADYVIQNASKPQDDNSLESEVLDTETNLAPIVTFFSTSAGELSYEYKDEQNQSYGLLSYTFSKLLNTMEQGTYQLLIDRLKLEMNKLGALQTPQAEGILTQKIFGGQLVQSSTFFNIKEVVDEKTILLEAGELHGITKGAVLEFYPKANPDQTQQQPIATGVVTYASTLDADVELNQAISATEIQKSWAYLKTPGFTPFKLKLQINLPAGEAKTAVENQLAAYPTIQLVDTFPDLQLITNQQNLQLINKQDKLIYQKELATAKVEAIVQRIVNYTQIAYLRNLEITDRVLSLEVKLVNKKTGLPVDKYEIGETMQLQITNTGKKAAYYQVVDIQPDNQFSVVIPSAPYVAADFMIQPGATQVVPIELEIYPPKGNELFKIIATNQPLDLNQSIFAQHQTKANEHNPFDKLLDMAKGKNNLKGEKARISIHSKSFSIY